MNNSSFFYLDSWSYFTDVVTNVFFPSSFKWDFGAYDAHKDPDLVLCLVDLVTVPTGNEKVIYETYIKIVDNIKRGVYECMMYFFTLFSLQQSWWQHQHPAQTEVGFDWQIERYLGPIKNFKVRYRMQRSYINQRQSHLFNIFSTQTKSCLNHERVAFENLSTEWEILIA